MIAASKFARRGALLAARALGAPAAGRGAALSTRAALAHEFIRCEDLERRVKAGEPAPRTAVVLHGMLGNQKNLRQLSTRLAQAATDCQMLLVTHRAHGQSERGEPPHTVHACARDLIGLLESSGIAPDFLVGHSFGGKVSLALLEELSSLSSPPFAPPATTWVLDCPPGRWAKGVNVDRQAVSQGVERVIETLKTVPQPLESKQQLIEELTGAGLTMGLAQWMTLNVRPDRAAGGLRWTFDLDIIEKLFESHKATDLWPLLESNWVAEHGLEINFVQAGLNPAWTDETLTRFRDGPNFPKVKVLELPDAGHWLHVDKPDELLEMMLPSFGAP